MARLKIGIWLILVMMIAACSAGPPQVTPTVAPTNTPDLTRIAASATHTPTFVAQLVFTSTPTATNTLTPSPTVTSTLTPSPTATDTVTPSITPTGTLTPSHTPSLTPTPTNTATPTATFTLTPSPMPTFTAIPTATATATVTPLILVDTDTPTFTPTFTATFTPIPSITPSETPTPTQTFTATPSATNTPNFAATSNAEILQTRAAASDTPVPATFTPVREASPTNTLVVATQDVTPTFATVEPDTVITPPDIVIEFPTSDVQPSPEFDENAVPATATFSSFTPTPFPIAQIPPTVAVTARPNIVVNAPVFSNSSTSAISFNVGAGNFIFNGEALSGDVRLFAVNPFDPSSYARTDSTGYLIFRPIGGGEGTVSTSPFYAGFTTDSAENNKNFVSELSWSPNGQRLAFVVQPPSGTDNINAGVWFWDAGSNNSYVLIHDCPNDGFNSCELSNHPVSHWQSMNVEWSPNSAQVIITAWLPDEGRQGIFISQMHFDSRRPEAPHFERWENGHWLNNQQILVSGIAPDGRSLIAIYNMVLGGVEDVLFDASANGLYIFDAVQRSNGQIVALGREGGRGGALRLYRIDNGAATPLSGTIGDSHPQRVQWSLGFGQVVLTINGGQYIVNTSNGTISQANVTGSVAVGGGITEEGQLLGPPPSGVVINSRYSAGQQVQYIGEIPRNMRVQPNTFAAWVDVINPNEFVTVLAGPYEANGYEWWEVSNARNNRAWTSTHTLDGFAFFSP